MPLKEEIYLSPRLPARAAELLRSGLEEGISRKGSQRLPTELKNSFGLFYTRFELRANNAGVFLTDEPFLPLALQNPANKGHADAFFRLRQKLFVTPNLPLSEQVSNAKFYVQSLAEDMRLSFHFGRVPASASSGLFELLEKFFGEIPFILELYASAPKRRADNRILPQDYNFCMLSGTLDDLSVAESRAPDLLESFSLNARIKTPLDSQGTIVAEVFEPGFYRFEPVR